MYDLDMLYTTRSLELDSTPDEVDPGQVLSELDIESELSEEERARVISYLQEYSGPDEERVRTLRERLLETTSAGSGDSIDFEWTPSRDHVPTSEDEVKDLLVRWSPPDLTERAKKALLLNPDFVTWSVRTFATHQRLDERPLVQIGNKELTYEIDPTVNRECVRITDCRGHNEKIEIGGQRTSYDFRIDCRTSDDVVEEAFIKGDNFIEYNCRNGEGNRVTLEYDLGKILPPEEPYVGHTADRDCSADYLIDTFLSHSLNEIQKIVRVDDIGLLQRMFGTSEAIRILLERDSIPETAAEIVEKESNNRKTVDSTHAEGVVSLLKSVPEVEIFEIDRYSNNDNLVIQSMGKSPEVVITKEMDIERGDEVVVRVGQNRPPHMTTENAYPLDDIPLDEIKNDPEQWIQENL
jgi:hypothetical protein